MKRICAKCNKDLEEEMVYHIVDDQYICCRCYDFYHRPKYNELDFDNLRKVFRKEQNKKTIECLKEVKSDLLDISNGYWKCFAMYGQQYMTIDDLEECLKEYIDTKIKEFEEEKQ